MRKRDPLCWYCYDTMDNCCTLDERPPMTTHRSGDVSCDRCGDLIAGEPWKHMDDPIVNGRDWCSRRCFFGHMYYLSPEYTIDRREEVEP